MEISCHDSSKFSRWDRESLHEAVDMVLEAQSRWEAGSITQTRLKDIVMAAGVNPNPDGILADRRLRGAFDWGTQVGLVPLPAVERCPRY